MNKVARKRFLSRIPGCSLGQEAPPVPPRPQAVRGPSTGLCKTIGMDATMAKCGFTMADLLVSEKRLEKVKGAHVTSGDIVAALESTIVHTHNLMNRKPLHEDIRKAAKQLSTQAQEMRGELQKREGDVPKKKLPDLRRDFAKMRRKVEKLSNAVSSYCGNATTLAAKKVARNPRARRRRKGR